MKKLLLLFGLVLAINSYATTTVYLVQEGGAGDPQWRTPVGGEILVDLTVQGKLLYAWYNTVLTAPAAGSTAQVWLMEGTYISGALAHKSNVEVYGGFAGTETAVGQRAKPENAKPWEFLNETVLDGTSTNSPFVAGAPSNQVFDGVTFTRGKATSYAVLLRGGETLRNCILRGNTSSVTGAGVKVWNTTTPINPCTFQGCRFTNNRANGSTGSNGAGAAIDMTTNNSAPHIIDNCMFDANYAGWKGSDIFVEGAGVKLTVRNSQFVGSTGGISINVESAASLADGLNFYNNTLVNNCNTGIYIKNSPYAKFYNCVFWSVNTAWAGGNNVNTEIKNSAMASNLLDSLKNIVKANNLYIESSNTGSDPAKCYPGFADPANSDFKLTGASSLIDKGDAALVTGVTTDFFGTSRPKGDAYDIGCAEFNPSTTVWSGSSWSPSAPTLNEMAQLNGHFTGAGFTCYDLGVAAGKQLTVTSGALTVYGDLTLENDAANGPATLVDNGNTVVVSGTATMKQPLTSEAGESSTSRYWYVSSPVTGATNQVFSGNGANTNYQFWSFLEANQPNPYINAPDTLTAGKGYVVRVQSDRMVSFTGAAGAGFNTGDRTIALTNTNPGDSAYAGFNLIGNPYPSFLNWDEVATAQASSIWYRSFNATTRTMLFDTYNGLTKVGANPSGHGSSNLIPPLQAFWTYVAGNQTLSLSNATREHADVSTNLLRSAPIVQEQPLIRLSVSNGSNRDEAVVAFNANALDGFDPYDSPKMSNANVNIPEIYMPVDNRELVINCMEPFETSREFPLGFRTGQAGEFSLNATELKHIEQGTMIVLKDRVNQVEHNLTATPEYLFTSDAVDNADRFSLVVSKTPTGVTTASLPSFEVLTDRSGRVMVYLPGSHHKGVQISVYDISGRRLLTKTAVGETTSIEMKLPSGIYLIAVQGDDVQGIKKVVVNQ